MYCHCHSQCHCQELDIPDGSLWYLVIPQYMSRVCINNDRYTMVSGWKYPILYKQYNRASRAGFRFNNDTVFSVVAIGIIKIRLLWCHLNVTMGIIMLVRWPLNVEAKLHRIWFKLIYDVRVHYWRKKRIPFQHGNWIPSRGITIIKICTVFCGILRDFLCR